MKNSDAPCKIQGCVVFIKSHNLFSSTQHINYVRCLMTLQACYNLVWVMSEKKNVTSMTGNFFSLS